MQINLHRILLVIIHKSELRPLNVKMRVFFWIQPTPTLIDADQFPQNIATHQSLINTKATEWGKSVYSFRYHLF